MKLKTLKELDRICICGHDKICRGDPYCNAIQWSDLKEEAITLATIFWINHKRMLEFSKNPPEVTCSATALSSEEYKTQALLYNDKYSLICTLFNLWEGQLNYSLPTEKERKDFLKYLKDLEQEVKDLKANGRSP